MSSRDRVAWDNRLEFTLNVVGYNVGLGNVWRFSYLCYKNGGGAFLIPYIIFVAFCGLPLLFQEIAMGQYTRYGGVGAWKMVPISQGIGFAALIMAPYVLMYFVVILAWCIFYLVHSFTNPVPWSSCDNPWNTNSCLPVAETVGSGSLYRSNITLMDLKNRTYSTKEFWSNYVLQQTDGIENIGSFTNWKMLICFLVSWILCYLCTHKGIKSTGKVAYVTVFLPYVALIILFVRGVTLEGSSTGILYYITPNITRLSDASVWLDAGGQVLYSFGVCFNVLIGFGSYNKFTVDCYKLSFLFVIACCGSSILSGFVVFSLVGHLAVMQNKTISEVAEGGPGLVFRIYPAGISLMPLPQLWSVVFFIMMISIGIDSVFGTIEGFITGLADIWPRYFNHDASRKYRCGLCFILMLCGLPLLADIRNLSNVYYISREEYTGLNHYILNHYSASGFCLFTAAFAESISIGWFCGVDKFYDNIKEMIGYCPSRYFGLCLKYFSPGLIMIILVCNFVFFSPLRLGDYVYPWWAILLGWIVSASVIIWIPLIAIITLFRQKGSLKRRCKDAIRSRIGEPASTKEDEEEVELQTLT